MLKPNLSGLTWPVVPNKLNGDTLSLLYQFDQTQWWPEERLLEHQLDQITPVYIPEGVEDQSVRAALLRDHHIEIGRGLGDFAGKVWRIGLMGESSRAEYVLTLLSAFESILPDAGFEVALGSGVGAASRSLAAS